MIRIRPAVPTDVDLVLSHIRPEDELELVSLNQNTAEEELRHCLQASETTYMSEVDEGPIALFGVIHDEESDGKTGIPWLVGTTLIPEHPNGFTRAGFRFLRDMSKEYDQLYNYVDVRNRRTALWLRFMGFTFEHVEPGFGARGEPYWFFTMDTRSYRKSR